MNDKYSMMRNLIKAIIDDVTDNPTRMDVTGEIEMKTPPIRAHQVLELTEFRELEEVFPLILKFSNVILTTPEFYKVRYPLMRLRIGNDVKVSFSLGSWLNAVLIQNELTWDASKQRLYLLHLSLTGRGYVGVWWSVDKEQMVITNDLSETLTDEVLEHYARIMVRCYESCPQYVNETNWISLISVLKLRDDVKRVSVRSQQG